MSAAATADWRRVDLDLEALQRVQDALPDPTLLVDAEGRVRHANAAACELLQFGAAEIDGRRVEELIPERDADAHRQYRALIERVPRRRPLPTDYSLAARRRDGSEVMVDISLAPLEIGGEPFLLVAIRAGGPSASIARERARIAQQSALLSLWDRALAAPSLAACIGLCLAELREMLRLERVELFEAAHAADGWKARLAHSTDPAARAGPWVRSLSGFEFESLITGDDAARGMAAVAGLQVVSAGGESALMLPVRSQRRIYGLLRLVRPAERGFGGDSVYVARSVVNLLAQVHEREEHDRLEVAAAKLEVLGQLSGGLAHDFNNLLGVVAGNLDLLERRLGSDREAAALLGAARRAVQRGSDLTNRMLTVARKRPVTVVPLNLARTAPGLLQLVRSTLGEKIELKVEMPTELSPILGDLTVLDTCVINLVSNARDAMPDGGTLSIAIEERELDAPPGDVCAGMLMPGRYVVLSITDTGSGMSEAVRARAFEPFFTTKDAGKGSGLGLKMVDSLMQQVGGCVSLSTEAGRGTTAYLCFRTAPVEAAVPEVGAPLLRGNGERVLVVEDDEAMRDTTVLLLADIGYRSVAVATIAEALAALEAHPDVALVFSDVVLARGETGVQLAERLLAERPGLPILLTSGYASPVLERCGPLLSKLPLLSKPYSRERLADAIHAARVAAPRVAGS